MEETDFNKIDNMLNQIEENLKEISITLKRNQQLLENNINH